MCSCTKDPKTTHQYLFSCNSDSIYKLKFFINICALNESSNNFSDVNLSKILLYGVEDFISQMKMTFFY